MIFKIYMDFEIDCLELSLSEEKAISSDSGTGLI